MPRSRVTEMPQRPSPRGPPSIRTSSSDSDPIHRRTTERSPKLAGGRSRSPRGAQSDLSHQKKLGSRIADLESRLSQAQEELKSLKNQLVSAEAAKKAAQEQLEKKSKKQQKATGAAVIPKKHSTSFESQGLNKKSSCIEYQTSDDVQLETNIFEFPTKQVPVEPTIEADRPADQNELESKPVSLPTRSPATTEQENLPFSELALKNAEINVLKARLDEREKELGVLHHENGDLKSQLDDKVSKMLSAESAIEELKLRLDKADQELERSKTSAAHIREKLEATEKAKQELENEMKKLQVQTEQWRKAADAAASILAGEVEMNGRRISERCGSMDKHYGSAFEPVDGYAGCVGSPGPIDDPDDVFGSGKRKGIKMFGDLWKKKGHK